MDKEALECALHCQKMELTSHNIYHSLVWVAKSDILRKTLGEMAKEELGHYAYWKKYTNQDVNPVEAQIVLYFFLSRIFGVSFVMKLMEKAEIREQLTCANLSIEIPGIPEIVAQERRHESELSNLINDEQLRYVGAVFRGMYIAVVQVVGVLAGLNLVFDNASIIALSAMAIGASTSFTMGGVDYLSGQVEGRKTTAKISLARRLKSPLITIAANLIAVFILISPFLYSFGYTALAISVVSAFVIITLFSYYLAVIHDDSLKRRASQMAMIAAVTIVLSFIAGNLVSLLHL